MGAYVDSYFYEIAVLAKSKKILSFYIKKLKASNISYSVTETNNHYLIVLEPTSEDNYSELSILVNEWNVDKSSVYK